MGTRLLGEMYNYRELSNKLNRTPWEKFKDGLSDGFKAAKIKFAKKKEEDEDVKS